MSKVVYSSSPQISVWEIVLPHRIVLNLLKHYELIKAYTKREFYAMYRETFLGWAWSIFTPLILLAIYTFVFGYIFHGRFRQSDAHESAGDFALALFIGMSFFNCIGQTMNSAPSLLLANTVYVKTLSFPLEVICVSAVLNIAINLAIGLAMCMIGFIFMHGGLDLSIIALVPYIIIVILMSLGISWFLSSLGVFIRDISALTGPLSMVLMFISGVFFPLSSVPPKVAWLFRLNPFADLVAGARSCFLYGVWPKPLHLLILFIISFLMATIGYWFFVRSKPAFADVI